MAILPIIHQATFKKEERLKSKKYIDALFGQGRAYNAYPLRIIYLPNSKLANHQVLFSVPKRRVRKAVDRNTLKRKMREAYRLHKHFLFPASEIYLSVAYIYIGSAASCRYATIEKCIISALRHLNTFYAPHHEAPL